MSPVGDIKLDAKLDVKASSPGEECDADDADDVPVGDDGTSAVSLEPMMVATEAALLAHDVKSLGVWPLQSGHAACPVLLCAENVNWREYRWCLQAYVDRAGKAQEKKVQVYQECHGTRQEFLARFKRKILEWLPHRQHLEWDRMWQSNSISSSVSLHVIDGRSSVPVVPLRGSETSSVPLRGSETNSVPLCGDHSKKIDNMVLGEVDARIDFIKNAELKSPNQAQREYFVHQYLSLLCTVVQWKVVNADQREELRTRTYMFCSEDRHHDGAFAAYSLKYLATEVSLFLSVPMYEHVFCRSSRLWMGYRPGLE